MGTNFYMRLKEPKVYTKVIEDYEEVHLAKRSAGWMPLFQSSDDIKSVSDMKRLYETGKYKIVNEYGDELTWDDFEKDVVNLEYPDMISHIEYCAKEYPYSVMNYYKDEDGYEFTTQEFC